ncbi:MAG TPA: response regulator [Acidimicrobiales bacterium]|nr:response regulator [Acidimicrobiales bacterium]
MPDILVASDAASVIDEVTAAVGGSGTTVRSVSSGLDVVPAIRDQLPDLAVLDLQIGNMGGVATCLNLRLEQDAGRVGQVPVLLLLDRRADVFLARRSGADGWVIKPLDPLRIRRAVDALLAGDTYVDPTAAPPASVPAAPLG